MLVPALAAWLGTGRELLGLHAVCRAWATWPERQCNAAWLALLAGGAVDVCAEALAAAGDADRSRLSGLRQRYLRHLRTLANWRRGVATRRHSIQMPLQSGLSGLSGLLRLAVGAGLVAAVVEGGDRLLIFSASTGRCVRTLLDKRHQSRFAHPLFDVSATPALLVLVGVSTGTPVLLRQLPSWMPAGEVPWVAAETSDRRAAWRIGCVDLLGDSLAVGCEGIVFVGSLRASPAPRLVQLVVADVWETYPSTSFCALWQLPGANRRPTRLLLLDRGHSVLLYVDLDTGTLHRGLFGPGASAERIGLHVDGGWLYYDSQDTSLQGNLHCVRSIARFGVPVPSPCCERDAVVVHRVSGAAVCFLLSSSSCSSSSWRSRAASSFFSSCPPPADPRPLLRPLATVMPACTEPVWAHDQRFLVYSSPTFPHSSSLCVLDYAP